MAMMFGGSKHVVSAGFCNLDDPIGCYGKSVSLNLTSRGEVDAELIRRAGMIDGF
jgi:hypothetical protein